jgi:hypothetical protein
MISRARKVTLAGGCMALTGWGVSMITNHPSWLATWAAPYIGFATVALFVASAVFAWSVIADVFSPKNDRDGRRGHTRWRWMWHLERKSRGISVEFESWFPLARLIPLERATIKALPKMRKLPVLMLTFNLDEQRREKLPGIVAQMLVDGASGTEIQLYGKHPPSEEFEEIPPDIVAQSEFSDDATFLCGAFESGFNGHKKPEYTCLSIKRRDLKRRLKELGCQ